MLKEFFEEDAVHLFEEFPKGAKDREWIPKVCKAKRIIITSDKAQTKGQGKTAVERRLLQKHRGRAFFLPNGFAEWKLEKQAACFFRCWEKIVEKAPEVKPGELFGLSESGQIKQMHLRKVA